LCAYQFSICKRERRTGWGCLNVGGEILDTVLTRINRGARIVICVAIKDIAQWMKEGKFNLREDLVAGIENFPDTPNKLFSGVNFGKLVLKVADG
jgi:NADPH-dependent curcumin reductase